MTRTSDKLRAIADAAMKPCPFCEEELRKMSEGLGWMHPLGNCTLADFHIEADKWSVERWNTRLAALTEQNAEGHRQYNEALDRLAALEAERAAGEAREWLPIDDDTPRDGTCIVLNSDSPLWRFPFVGVWRKSADHKSGWWHFAEEDMNHLYSVSELVNQWSPVPALAKQGPGS